MTDNARGETFQEMIWRLLLEAGETEATITIGDHQFQVELPENLVETPEG